MASISGWISAALIAIAALVPIAYRMRAGRRAPPGAPSIRGHVAVGFATAMCGFLHTLVVLPELGSEAAVGGGTVALLAGAVAFLVLVAHAGLGLQLRNVRLRDRVRKRRTHVATGLILAAVVAAHAGLLMRGAR